MEPFRTLTGAAAPFLENDVNTDQISPAASLHSLDPDYGAMLFGRWRYLADGKENPDFVLNRPPFRSAKILVTGDNFGCGSSRESAVWAMTGFGISCIVARGFADIYRENCLRNGVLPIVFAEGQAAEFEALVVETDGAAPFTVDLETQTIACPNGAAIGFDIAPAERDALLKGLDDIGLTLEHAAEIAAWERRARQERPWFQHVTERR